ncbi:MAG TPA: hypothetical protein VIT83_04935 [Gammaproteobacteria bacterium]
MFLQIMNRAMNEAIFHPLAGEPPRGAAHPDAEHRSAMVRSGVRRRPKADIAPVKSAPATFEIFASAFNTAVHGR